jgi:hypothetical protein
VRPPEALVSHSHLASVLQKGRKGANICAGHSGNLDHSGTEAKMKMLILRGIAGHYAGRDWARGAFDERMWRARPARTVSRLKWPWLSFVATGPLARFVDFRAAATTYST